MSCHSWSRSIRATALGFSVASVSATPARADELLNQAQAAFTAGKWEEAAKLFGDVVKADPKSAVGEFRLGVSLLYLKQPQTAKGHQIGRASCRERV